MIKHILSLLVLLALGCDVNKAAEVEYLKDHRTDLCFAQYFNGKGWSVTNVPCTPEVQRLIVKDR